MISVARLASPRPVRTSLELFGVRSRVAVTLRRVPAVVHPCITWELSREVQEGGCWQPVGSREASRLQAHWVQSLVSKLPSWQFNIEARQDCCDGSVITGQHSQATTAQLDIILNTWSRARLEIHKLGLGSNRCSGDFFGIWSNLCRVTLSTDKIS